MKIHIERPLPSGCTQPSGNLSEDKFHSPALGQRRPVFMWMALLAGLFLILLKSPSVRADQNPPGCEGSGLGILLYTSASDVHIGNTLQYSVTIFNGTGSGPIVCDATSVTASLVTPDGVVHSINLGANTNLVNGQADYYPNVVSYVVRAQDIQPGGTVNATASDTGVIHQNTVDSQGGGNQGVNTIVSLPCIGITATCTNGVGETGLITFGGNVTNCGNDVLYGVAVTNMVNGTAVQVAYFATLGTNSSVSFNGSYIPANACTPGTAVLTAYGTDSGTSQPTNVMSSAVLACANILTPGINVTKTCPVSPVAPGQLLTFSGTVSNTGNITLTGVVVVNNQPAPNTAVFTIASLAPGAVASFTGSYLAPTNCSVTDTLLASATSTCGVAVSNTATATCPIATTPLIVVSESCPVNPVVPGSLLTYGGTVTNAGNITLTNIVILSSVNGSTPIFRATLLVPGAGTNFTGSYLAPTNCFSTTVLTASGQGSCGLVSTNTASATCPIVTTAQIQITQSCPVGVLVPGGILTFAGTVTNTGNITLTNVVVVNNQIGQVFTIASLSPGAGAGYTGSYLTPTNCSATSTSTATGMSICGAAATNSVTTTCAISTIPKLVIIESCPPNAPMPGGLLTYSGSVSNSGNILITNIVVMNNLSGGTPIYTAALLAPSQVAYFSGTYLAPTNCSSTSISTVTGQSICGIAVTNTASATCPIQTTPAIIVTQTCPLIPVYPGGILTYSGSVSNAGNITLTNIVVVNNEPAANTTIYTLATLVPGATANFTGSYQVPLNCCVVFSTVQASGQGCAGQAVTNTDTHTCIVATTPQLVVTKICNPGSLQPGSLLTYSGSVSNSGNITLTGVTVTDNESPGNPPFAGSINLVPGQSANFSGSYIVQPDFCGSDTLTATGLDICNYLPITATVNTTCPITTSPAIIVTKNCPLLPTPRGGLFTYTGSVSNAGNVSLVNVYVTDDEPSNNTPVIGPITLSPGRTVNFTNSYVAPVCCCVIIDTVTAIGQGLCNHSNVNATSTTVCPLLTIPSIAVVPNCPGSPIPMGTLYMFSGYVTNTGNSIMTNVFVFGPQSASSPILGPINLAPGEGEPYMGSYRVPFNICSVNVSASGQDTCAGNVATNMASCPVATTGQLVLTQNCPVAPVSPGGLLTYSGSISNAGNITIANVMILNNQSGATPIFTTAALAPGAVANFTGSYQAPATCFSSSISTAIGQTICGVPVTNTISTSCPITSVPAIAIAETCPPGPVAAGSSVVYNGSVTNIGNVTLLNVLVFSSQSTNTPVFGPVTLAPGASASFMGNYIASGGSNPMTNITIITNSLGSITTNLVSTITTNNTLVVSTNVVSPTFGTINPVTDAIIDRFNVTNGLKGLMYADQDENWGPTLFYAVRTPATGPDDFDTIAPSSVVTDRFALTSTNYDSLTLAAPDVGYGANNFYYVRHDNNGVSTFGVIKAAGASSSADLWPLATTGYNGLAFAAANLGYGANLFYSLRELATTVSTFGTINPTPGGIETDLYGVGTNFDALVYVNAALSTWGTDNFAYLRHTGTGSIIGTIDPITMAITDRLNLGTNFFSDLTFTPTDVGYGANLFYYLRPQRLILTTNNVAVFTTNQVTTLITNGVSSYTTNIVVTFTPTNTLTTFAEDVCQNSTVGAMANCQSTGTSLASPLITKPSEVNGTFSLIFPTLTGDSYTLQYKNKLTDLVWTNLQTVPGNGGNETIMDPTAGSQPSRFYRIVVTP